MLIRKDDSKTNQAFLKVVVTASQGVLLDWMGTSESCTFFIDKEVFANVAGERDPAKEEAFLKEFCIQTVANLKLLDSKQDFPEYGFRRIVPTDKPHTYEVIWVQHNGYAQAREIQLQKKFPADLIATISADAKPSAEFMAQHAKCEVYVSGEHARSELSAPIPVIAGVPGVRLVTLPTPRPELQLKTENDYSPEKVVKESGLEYDEIMLSIQTALAAQKKSLVPLYKELEESRLSSRQCLDEATILVVENTTPKQPGAKFEKEASNSTETFSKPQEEVIESAEQFAHYVASKSHTIQWVETEIDTLLKEEEQRLNNQPSEFDDFIVKTYVAEVNAAIKFEFIKKQAIYCLYEAARQYFQHRFEHDPDFNIENFNKELQNFFGAEFSVQQLQFQPDIEEIYRLFLPCSLNELQHKTNKVLDYFAAKYPALLDLFHDQLIQLNDLKDAPAFHGLFNTQQPLITFAKTWTYSESKQGFAWTGQVLEFEREMNRVETNTREQIDEERIRLVSNANDSGSLRFFVNTRLIEVANQRKNLRRRFSFAKTLHENRLKIAGLIRRLSHVESNVKELLEVEKERLLCVEQDFNSVARKQYLHYEAAINAISDIKHAVIDSIYGAVNDYVRKLAAEGRDAINAKLKEKFAGIFTLSLDNELMPDLKGLYDSLEDNSIAALQELIQHMLDQCQYDYCALTCLQEQLEQLKNSSSLAQCDAPVDLQASKSTFTFGASVYSFEQEMKEKAIAAQDIMSDAFEVILRAANTEKRNIALQEGRKLLESVTKQRESISSIASFKRMAGSFPGLYKQHQSRLMKCIRTLGEQVEKTASPQVVGHYSFDLNRLSGANKEKKLGHLLRLAELKKLQTQKKLASAESDELARLEEIDRKEIERRLTVAKKIKELRPKIVGLATSLAFYHELAMASEALLNTSVDFTTVEGLVSNLGSASTDRSVLIVQKQLEKIEAAMVYQLADALNLVEALISAGAENTVMRVNQIQDAANEIKGLRARAVSNAVIPQTLSDLSRVPATLADLQAKLNSEQVSFADALRNINVTMEFPGAAEVTQNITRAIEALVRASDDVENNLKEIESAEADEFEAKAIAAQEILLNCNALVEYMNNQIKKIHAQGQDVINAAKEDKKNERIAGAMVLTVAEPVLSGLVSAKEEFLKKQYHALRVELDSFINAHLLDDKQSKDLSEVEEVQAAILHFETAQRVIDQAKANLALVAENVAIAQELSESEDYGVEHDDQFALVAATATKNLEEGNTLLAGISEEQLDYDARKQAALAGVRAEIIERTKTKVDEISTAANIEIALLDKKLRSLSNEVGHEVTCSLGSPVREDSRKFSGALSSVHDELDIAVSQARNLTSDFEGGFKRVKARLQAARKYMEEAHGALDSYEEKTKVLIAEKKEREEENERRRQEEAPRAAEEAKTTQNNNLIALYNMFIETLTTKECLQNWERRVSVSRFSIANDTGSYKVPCGISEWKKIISTQEGDDLPKEKNILKKIEAGDDVTANMDAIQNVLTALVENAQKSVTRGNSFRYRWFTSRDEHMDKTYKAVMDLKVDNITNENLDAMRNLLYIPQQPVDDKVLVKS